MDPAYRGQRKGEGERMEGSMGGAFRGLMGAGEGDVEKEREDDRCEEEGRERSREQEEYIHQGEEETKRE